MQIYTKKMRDTDLITGERFTVWYGFEHDGKFYQRTHDLARLQNRWEEIVKWVDGDEGIPDGWKPL
jgi:hypothetical protein